jgi:HD-like signal output (HDOD) protein/CheY-like chemotaxis protein
MAFAQPSPTTEPVTDAGPRKAVLFVDDEPQILSGLRRSLHGMRDEWDMSFADGGQAALLAMSEKPFDVIVSDMRMPGMSGPELLARVAAEYPTTIRIVLTGQAAEGDMLKAIKNAHQYLTKPCDSAELAGAVRRATTTLELIADDHLIKFVTSLDSVPSYPALYDELVAIAESDDPSLEAVGAVIDQDPAMSLKVLQVVNSSFFGLKTGVTDPRRATSLLGADTVISMVLAAHVFHSAADLVQQGVDLDTMWVHGARIAEHAKQIATMEDQRAEAIHLCYTAGLMSSVGTLILASSDPELFVRTAEPGTWLTEAEEREAFGVTSGAIGGYLLSMWGLPPQLVEAVGYYRHPERLGPHTEFRPLTAVHVADGFDPLTAELHVDETYIGSIGLADRITDWAEALAKRC